MFGLFGKKSDATEIVKSANIAWIRLNIYDDAKNFALSELLDMLEGVSDLLDKQNVTLSSRGSLLSDLPHFPNNSTGDRAAMKLINSISDDLMKCQKLMMDEIDSGKNLNLLEVTALMHISHVFRAFSVHDKTPGWKDFFENIRRDLRIYYKESRS
jgi:hypothetical protein